jgi:pimeloyl-ACP methyl ester carboxylesterase
MKEKIYSLRIDDVHSLCVKEFYCEKALDHQKQTILLIHGATIASELWVNDYKQYSWCHRLASLGYHVFTCDLLGFGLSKADIDLLKISDTRASEISKHAIKLINHILHTTFQDKISVVACSWGTVVLTKILTENTHNISKAVFYAPVSYDFNAANYWLNKYESIPTNDNGEKSGYVFVDANSFIARWDEEIPFDDKAAWRNNKVLMSIVNNTMLNSATQNSSFLVPTGPLADLADIFSNKIIHHPERITIPSLVIRASHDLTSTEKSSRKFYNSIQSSEKTYFGIKNGTHFALLEKSMEKIFAQTMTFLENNH